jgi:hypothetical protein
MQFLTLHLVPGALQGNFFETTCTTRSIQWAFKNSEQKADKIELGHGVEEINAQDFSLI